MKWTRSALVARARPFWPTVISSLFLLCILAVLIGRAMHVCQGHFGYPLDDTYIHMAMAKNFAAHGIWGVTRYEFSSSTSSPLYTLLLSVSYALTGIREVTPLVINVVLGILLLVVSDSLLLRRQIAPATRLVVLCFLVVAVPLPTLVFVGMEHVLHTVFTLIFLHLSATYLADRGSPDTKRFAIYVPLTALLVTARYEGIFLVGMAGILFGMQKRWPLAAALACSSFVPLAAYGWICVSHGWYAIPNSLLLKANLPASQSLGLFGTFFYTLRVNFSWGFHVVVLIGIAVLLIIAGDRIPVRRKGYSRYFLLLFAASATLHLCFARVGWYWRYESYLIAAGIIAITLSIAGAGLSKSGKIALPAIALMLLATLILSYRTSHAFSRTSKAVSDIYNQQYQMGLFARDYLGGQTLVLNDIGAVGFLSDVRILDLIGLGSIDPVVARRRRVYSPGWLAHWASEHNSVLAITYPWFIVPGWTKLQTWTIPGNFISGSDTVQFCVPNPQHADRLEESLRQFRPSLPNRVIVQ